MSGDSEDEEQWCQQPAENEEEDEEELCSEDEQEAEVNLSEDEYVKTIAALHWIAAAAFRHQHGTQQGEEGMGAAGEAGKAAAAERAPKRRRSAPRVCSNCGCSLVPEEQQAEKPPCFPDFKCINKGRVLTLKCRKCGQRQPSPAITQGTCLFMDWPDRSSLVGMVRCIAKDGTLHIQHLSSRLRLPGACRYDIIRDSSSSDPDIYLLTRRHSDVPGAEFAAAWGRGEAGMLGPCKLFFQPVGLFDFLAVREDGCPGFGCCASRGCACLNPWAAHGGSPYHNKCQHAPDPAEPQADGKGGCSLQGVTYAPGDLAWLLPKHARWSGGQTRVADAQLELVRIVSLGYPGPPDSQESQLPLSAIAQDLMLRYERFELSSSVDGFCYSPTGELQLCGAKWLRGLADLEQRAPGSRVLSGIGSGATEGLGGTPGSGGAGGSGSGAAGATELPSAAGEAADGGGAASRQRTPSGSDCSANPSWCSDDGEVSSGDGCDSDASCGAASPSTDGGGGRRPSRAGQPRPQQGPWPVEICDLFCGAGGLSLGLLMCLGPRAKVKWAVDLFKEALDTYRQCHPGSRTFLEDVRSVLAGSRAGRRGYPPIGCPAGTWRMLVGGPPCQGFSKANKGSAEEKARKNVLVALFISVLFTLRWPLSIMENVNGLLSAGDTMQRIIQAAVSAGYQVRWRLLNAGCYGLAEHRRRLIVLLVRHDVPAPSFPLPYTLFPGAGGYQEPPGQPCLLQDRLARAYSGVPRAWRAHVVVPDAAPLPALTARDVLDDLPREAAAPDAAAQYDREARCYYAARMRGRGIGGGSSSGSGGGDSGSSSSGSGGHPRSSGCSSHGAAVDLAAVGAPLRNHCTLGLAEDTLARIRLIPKEGQPPPPGRSRWEGECSVPAHPFQPPRAGNFLDLPADLLQSRMPHLAENRCKAKLWGIYARLKWCSHFATLTTSPSLYSDTTSTILHPEADRPLTVRESARVQGFPDFVEFSGNPAQAYKQVGNAVPPPLAEALGRELARAFAEAEARWQQQQQQRR